MYSSVWWLVSMPVTLLAENLFTTSVRLSVKLDVLISDGINSMLLRTCCTMSQPITAANRLTREVSNVPQSAHELPMTGHVDGQAPPVSL